MLVMFPIALYVTGVIFDVIHLISDNDTFSEVGFWMITAGLIGAVLAALTGLLDWTKIPADTRAKGVGLRHGLLNSIVLVMFLISWAIRVDRPAHVPGGGLVFLEILAVAIAGAAAWLGGELVDRLAIGVDEDAHPNAPSSLSRSTSRIHAPAAAGRARR